MMRHINSRTCDLVLFKLHDQDLVVLWYSLINVWDTQKNIFNKKIIRYGRIYFVYVVVHFF